MSQMSRRRDFECVVIDGARRSGLQCHQSAGGPRGIFIHERVGFLQEVVGRTEQRFCRSCRQPRRRERSEESLDGISAMTESARNHSISKVKSKRPDRPLMAGCSTASVITDDILLVTTIQIPDWISLSVEFSCLFSLRLISNVSMCDCEMRHRTGASLVFCALFSFPRLKP